MPTSKLPSDLRLLPPPLVAQLGQGGFSAERLVALAATLGGTEAERALRRDKRNRVAGPVRAPSESEIPKLPEPGSEPYAQLEAAGHRAIQAGRLAFCVMAGGMATRMGGVVKALVEAVDGKTFLELRLMENRVWCQRVGRNVPLWLMTSDATDGPIRDALERLGAPAHVRTFRQDLSLRLTADGELFREDDGSYSTYAPGHGDLPDALRRSHLLRGFRDAGGEVVWITNLDNLGATIDPAILGHFLSSGADVMVEVCAKAEKDRGGIPVHAGGRLQVLEEFRLPVDFDASSVRVFNTNTFLVKAEPLDTADVPWNWFEVEKKVDGRPAIQFERLLQELTAVLPSAYLTVPRDGARSRFLPVKDFDELELRRADIRAVAASRGIL